MPSEAEYIISVLEKNGHTAYVVGGCVRDSLLNANPQDWDICTSALPLETIQYFKGMRIIETGLKHGTITLIINKRPFEITTYRIDGDYSDNRRPDKVEFVRNLRDDLARRDFTINAMAYNHRDGLVDYFNGKSHLNSGLICCVGEPSKRFQEDALRIMRALRFASTLRFSIETKTSFAIFENKHLLINIAAERIANEFNKLLLGDNAKEVLLEHMEVIQEFMPEIAAKTSEAQARVLACLNYIPKDIVLRLVMYFQIFAQNAKIDDPYCFAANIAKNVLTKLKYDKKTIEEVVVLVRYSNCPVSAESVNLKKWLNILGEDRFYKLIQIKKAMPSEEFYIQSVMPLLNEIIESGQCYCLKDLEINGDDLIEHGFTKGKEIGYALNKLLNNVIEGKLHNEREELLRCANSLNPEIKT